jgi:hypothetical protein
MECSQKRCSSMNKITLLSFLLISLTVLISSCKEEAAAENHEIGPPVPYVSDIKEGEELKAKIQLENRKKWKLIKVDSFKKGEEGHLAFDGKPLTMWHTMWGGKNIPKQPHEIQIDMGEELELHGFTYLPRQEGGVNGTVKVYEFYVSNDVEKWGKPVAKGNFKDIEKSFGLQYREFKPVKGRYIRFLSKRAVKNQIWTSCAELNVIIEE